MKKITFLYLLFFTIASVGQIFGQAPVITNPANQTVTEGETATFSVSLISGATPVSYQWQTSLSGTGTDWTNIPGATSSSYTTAPTTLDMDGIWFRCIATNVSGSVNSLNASLTVNAAVPQITVQPTDQNVFVGSTATFSLTASSSIAISYQWYLNSVAITGATSSSYTTSTITDLSSNGDEYYCIVSNASGSTESNHVILNVSFSNERVSDQLQVLYDFQEGSGTVINDVSGVGSPLNLTVATASTVQWLDDGLLLKNRTLIQSSTNATKIIDACKTSNEITIEAWIRPSNLGQQAKTGRIAGVSAGVDTRNSTIWQRGSVYGSSTRTTATDNDGHPNVETAPYTADLSLNHVVYTYSTTGEAKIYKNGNLVETAMVGGDFSNWASNEKFVLGDEPDNSNKPWEGTYYLIAVYSKALNSDEITHNYELGVPLTTDLAIVQNPVDDGDVVGGELKFSVGAIGKLPFTYQWQFDDGSGWENSPNGNIATIVNDDPTIWVSNRKVRCIVTNSTGTVYSEIAWQYVTDPSTKVTDGQVASYNFSEGSGSVINDKSGVGTPLNLEISDTNAVQWTQYGLLVNSSTNISSTDPASKIINACKSTNEVSVEAWVKPSNLTQTSARIATIAGDASHANVLVEQSGDVFSGVVRTSESSSTGTGVDSDPGTASEELVHVVFTRSWDGFRHLYVNGVDYSNFYGNPYFGNLSSWDDSYKLGIGNDLVDERPWYGLYNSLKIFNRELSAAEVNQDFELGPNGGIPTIQAPGSVSTMAESDKEIKIAWADSSSDEMGFVVERSLVSDGSFVKIDTVTANITTYTDSSVTEAQDYQYRIKSFNSIISSSYAYSDTVTSKLKAPNQLHANAVAPGEITVSWTDASQFETGTIIEKSVGDSLNYAIIDSVAANETSYTDTNVMEGQMYYYRAKYYNATNASNYSNETSATGVYAEINAPTNLSADLHSEYGVPVLTWDDNSDNEDGFIIERRKSETGSNFTVIDTVEANVTTYTDASVEDNTTYIYQVYAFNEGKTSLKTDIAIVSVLVSIKQDNSIPEDYSLSQNYPNPFNPTTNINFDLPEAANVSLVIYNLLGQRVMRVFNKDFSAGRYVYNFDGSQLTSGIYIYAIIANGVNGKNFSSTKKMILLK